MSLLIEDGAEQSRVCDIRGAPGAAGAARYQQCRMDGMGDAWDIAYAALFPVVFYEK